MKIFNVYQDAIDACVADNYFSVAHLYSDDQPKGLHINDCCELYYAISGAGQFWIDNCVYTIEKGDVFFINQYERHCLMRVDASMCERILVLISPAYLQSVCTDATDLKAAFNRPPIRPGVVFTHKIHLSVEEQQRFLFYIDNLKSVENFGSDLMERSLLTLLMVYMTKRYLACIHSRGILKDGGTDRTDVKVDGILSYINQHLEDPIGVEQIAAEFFLSPSYVCRIFKATTGTTINQYITARRIARAKYLLTMGSSVTDAAQQSGFGDYSNFYKAFLKFTDVSPKKFVQLSTHKDLTGR